MALRASILEHDGVHDKIISCGHNLIARVKGKKHVVSFCYRPKGSSSIYHLGNYPEMNLAQARVIINRLKKEDQKNLIVDADTQTVKVNRTFGKVANDWLESKKELAHFPNYRKCVSFLSELFPLDVADIKNVLVKEILLDPKKDISAYKLKETVWCLCSILDLAIEDDLIEHHNCAVLKQSSAFPKLARSDGYKYILFNELGPLFKEIGQQDFRYRSYFLMLCVTCLRPAECRTLKYSYFDLDERIISIHPENMKIKKTQPFRVPLTDLMVKIFKKCKAHKIDSDEEFLFPAKRSRHECMNEPDLSTVFKICSKGQAHPHGFRKTARSYFADHGIAIEVSAKCLDHVIDTGADRLYQKSDLLELSRAVMEQYSEDVLTQISNIDHYLRD